MAASVPEISPSTYPPFAPRLMGGFAPALVQLRASWCASIGPSPNPDCASGRMRWSSPPGHAASVAEEAAQSSVPVMIFARSRQMLANSFEVLRWLREQGANCLVITEDQCAAIRNDGGY